MLADRFVELKRRYDFVAMICMELMNSNRVYYPESMLNRKKFERLIDERIRRDTSKMSTVPG